MKNVHLIPTDKPSKLRIGNNGNFVIGLTQSATASKNDSYTNQNIYITSDEEIKEDYVIAYGVVIKVMIFDKETLYSVNGTKVKREDCKKITLTDNQDLIDDGVQAIDDEFLEWFVKNPSCDEVETEFFAKFHNNLYKIIIPKEEAKQETLEEAARNYRDLKLPDDLYDGFIAGAKWQQERMYSEEEVIKILLARNADLGIIGKTSAVVEFIKQFKKK